MQVHLFSALAGAGLLGLALVAAGAVQVPVPIQHIPTGDHGLVRVAGIPDPRQMVVIKEGTAFVVPTGKILVVTALGATANSVVVDLLVDGQREVQAVANIPTGGPATVGPLPLLGVFSVLNYSAGFVLHGRELSLALLLQRCRPRAVLSITAIHLGRKACAGSLEQCAVVEAAA